MADSQSSAREKRARNEQSYSWPTRVGWDGHAICSIVDQSFRHQQLTFVVKSKPQISIWSFRFLIANKTQRCLDVETEKPVTLCFCFAAVHLPGAARSVQREVRAVRDARRVHGRLAGAALLLSHRPPHVRHSARRHGHRLHAHLLHHCQEVTWPAERRFVSSTTYKYM